MAQNNVGPDMVLTKWDDEGRLPKILQPYNQAAPINLVTREWLELWKISGRKIKGRDKATLKKRAEWVKDYIDDWIIERARKEYGPDYPAVKPVWSF